MRPIPLLLAVLCATCTMQAQFIVPDQEYRCPAGDMECQSQIASSGRKPLPAYEERESKNGNKYSINYVEFRDHGKLWNERELNDALNVIRRARGAENNESALVVVYIHGWQNNADEPVGTCQDVCKFRDTLLARLADSAAEAGGKPLKVVGIYMAWRGRMYTREPFNHIYSYYTRRRMAMMIGRSGMYSALSEIENAVGEKRENYVLVLAGHSMGARVLEFAAEDNKQHEGFMLKYRNQMRKMALELPVPIHLKPESRPEQAQKMNLALPADLFLYINAATASTITRHTIKDTREACAKMPDAPLCKADPFYIAISSRGDRATGITMPIANFFYPAFGTDGIRLSSAANSASLHTHTEPGKGCPPNSSLCFKLNPKDPSTTQSIVRIDGKEQIPGRANQPFWIFNVKADVMKSHGDMWNDGATDLIAQMITRNEKFKTLSIQPEMNVKNESLHPATTNANTHTGDAIVTTGEVGRANSSSAQAQGHVQTLISQ
jgi:pimeloyl-ACP methyl ester carboxylesterase